MKAAASPERRPEPGGFLVPRATAWLVFTMTFLLMVLDFVDRQIVVSMFPYLKAQWGLSDTQLGALVSVISITVALATLPIASLVDRWSRVKSIVLMGTVWSLATIACAFARSYTQLFAVRSAIGLGEAGYGPAGGALLSTMFPTRLRGTVLGGFLAASSIGSVLGVLLGGALAEQWGWQAGFGIVGVPGLILALLFLIVPDYQSARPVGAGSAAGNQLRSWMTSMAAVFRARSGVAASIGGALQLLVVSTVYAWLPSFFNRTYGLPAPQAGIRAALVVLLGSLGAFWWGHVADRLGRRNPRNKLLVPAAAAVSTCVLLLAAFALLAPGSWQFLLIGLGGFVMTASVGPVAAVAIDVTHPGLRASAAAMVALVQNLFGLAVGPFLAGALSDVFGLQFALALISLVCLLAASILALGSRTYVHDLKNAEGTGRA